MKTVVILFISFLITACGHVQRHTKSGYVAKDHFQAKQDHEYNLAKHQVGLGNKAQLTQAEHARVLQQLRLQKLESQLVTKRQKKLYYDNKPYMNQRQMFEYLNLNSEAQRKSYLTSQNIHAPKMENYPAELTELIEGNELALGMTKDMVKQSWGEPDTVEYAGNPIYQNEKWSYRTTSPSLNGYVHENRVIIFESGRVAGWTKEK